MLQWRNRIVTLLIETPVLSWRQIHRALMTDGYSPRIEAQIDRDLRLMIATRDLHQPTHGAYAISPKREEERA